MTDSTTTKPDNPAAFPSRRDVPDGLVSYRADVPGMTLRDWFAGQAFELAFGINREYLEKVSRDPLYPIYQATARDAYMAADAMLAERSKSHD